MKNITRAAHYEQITVNNNTQVSYTLSLNSNTCWGKNKHYSQHRKNSVKLYNGIGDVMPSVTIGQWWQKYQSQSTEKIIDAPNENVISKNTLGAESALVSITPCYRQLTRSSRMEIAVLPERQRFVSLPL